MSENILDIIHRIQYEVTGNQSLKEPLEILKQQSKALGEAIGLMQKLSQQIAELGANADKAYKDKLNANLQKAKENQAQLTQGIAETIQSNKKLNEEFLKETSIIGGLTIRMNELKDARFKASDVKEIEIYNREIKELEKSITHLMTIGTRPVRITNALPRPADYFVRPNTVSQQSIAAVRSAGGITPEIQQAQGLIQRLNAEIARLNKQKLLAGSEQEVRRVNRELANTQRELERVSNLGRKTNIFGSIGSSILQGVGIGTGMQLLSQGVGVFTNALSDASKMAGEIEGVRRAFERLNRPELLNELRDATRGTVSDLELMKQAVQYGNFGLPVDRMAQALRFARIRAKETGQEVDYLVQSIVTGIGRQSPLILDNLGINAKRVSDEFKRTGDFAEAAFNIIQEETAKSGADLEDYAERIARINAEIENQKTSFGETLNYLKDFWSSFGLQVGNGLLQIVNLGNAERDYFAEFEKRQADKEKAEMQGLRVNAQINSQYIKNFEAYASQYQSADQASRDKIVQQARTHYESMLKAARGWMSQSNEEHQVYFQSLERAFQLFNQNVRKAQVNLAAQTPQNVVGLRQQQLTDIQSSISQRRQDLSSRPEDAAEVARLTKLSEAIDKELEKINGTTKKSVKTGKDAYASGKERLKIQEDLAKLNDEYLKSLNKQKDDEKRSYDLWLSSAEYAASSINQREARERQFNDSLKTIDSLRRIRLEVLNSESIQKQLDLANRFNKRGDAAALGLRLNESLSEIIDLRLQLRLHVVTSISSIGDERAEAQQNAKEAIDKSAKDIGKYVDQVQDRLNKNLDKKRKDDLEKEKKILEDRKQAYQDMYVSIIQNADFAINSILDNQIRALDREIEYRQYAVEKAKLLAERGNADVLKEEEDRLRKVTAEREKAADKQLQLNALIQASNMAVALSEAIGAVVKAASQGDPYTIAARVIAAVAALVGGIAAISTAFSTVNTRRYKDGEIDIQGPGTSKSDSIPARLSKGESVMTAEATAKYKPYLEAMNNLSFKMPEFLMPKYKPFEFNPELFKAGQFGRAQNSDRMEKRLGQIVDRLDKIDHVVNVVQKLDAYGLTQRVESIKRQERKRFT